MNIIIIKSQNYIPVAGSTIAHRISRRILKVVANWIESQSIMKQHWELFCTTSASRHVPYRVWLRHGAYLEMKYKSQSE